MPFKQLLASQHLPNAKRALCLSIVGFSFITLLLFVTVAQAVDSPPSPLVFRTELLASGGQNGHMLLDANDFPQVAYDTYNNLWYAH